MVRHVLVASLLLLAVACVVARPTGGCRRAPSPFTTLQRFIRRSAAITTSLRNLRYIRERRWRSSFPVWKTLHKMQERAMDISSLPPQLPVPSSEEETALDFNDERPDTDRDLSAAGLGGVVKEGGFWHNEPFVFPDMPKPAKDPWKGGETPVVEGWGSVAEGWAPEGWAPVAYSSPQTADGHQESFAEGWGAYSEPKCSDDIVGNPCTRHSDCPGCRLFHCSASTNSCVAGPEPDTHLDGFF